MVFLTGSPSHVRKEFRAYTLTSRKCLGKCIAKKCIMAMQEWRFCEVLSLYQDHRSPDGAKSSKLRIGERV